MSLEKTYIAWCVSYDFKCCLRVSLDDTVLNLCARMGPQMHCSPSDLVLISKGKILNNYMDNTLEALELFKPKSASTTLSNRCKILVIRRTTTWIHITTTFLCTTSLKPIICRMHTASPVSNIKKQLREILRCPTASLVLYGANAALLPDTMTIQDLRVSSGCRLYCRILAEEPTPQEFTAIYTGGHVCNGGMVVTEQIRAADAKWHNGAIGRGPAPQRKRGCDNGPEADSCGRKAARGAFAGMRRGFLTCRGPAGGSAAGLSAGGPASASGDDGRSKTGHLNRGVDAADS